MAFFVSFFMFITMFSIALLVFKGVKIVPEDQKWIVQKLGRFDRELTPGLHILIPFIEKAVRKDAGGSERKSASSYTVAGDNNRNIL